MFIYLVDVMDRYVEIFGIVIVVFVLVLYMFWICIFIEIRFYVILRFGFWFK